MPDQTPAIKVRVKIGDVEVTTISPWSQDYNEVLLKTKATARDMYREIKNVEQLKNDYLMCVNVLNGK